MVEDVRVFFFRNEVTTSFSPIVTFAHYYNGDEDLGGTGYFQRTYVQSQFPSAEVNKVTVRVQVATGISLEGMEVTTNQGSGVIDGGSTRWPTITITDVSASEYLQVTVGNTLVAFILPFEG